MSAIRLFFKRMFCNHDFQPYGNLRCMCRDHAWMDGKLSLWVCPKCGEYQVRNHPIEEDKND